MWGPREQPLPVSQWAPVKAGGHWQTKAPGRSLQEPPFLQGCAWHSSVSEERDTDTRLHGPRPGASWASDCSLACPHCPRSLSRPLLPSLPRLCGHLACTGMREQASWGLPPSLARMQDWDLPPAPHPFSAPGSSPPLSPRPPTSQSLREAGERVTVSCCQLRSVLLGTVGKSIYKLLPLWTSDPAGAQESRQHPARPQHTERSGWAGAVLGAGAQGEWPAHGRRGPPYPAHSGFLHALGCRRTGTRRRGPGRSPRAGTVGIGTRRFLSEESPGARRRGRPQE